MPLYASVTGMLAWGLVETGALERAEEAGMAALHMDARVWRRAREGARETGRITAACGRCPSMQEGWALRACVHASSLAGRATDALRLLRETHVRACPCGQRGTHD